MLHPPDGLHLPVCWLKSTTGVPCPGCGLSRSLSCTLRGRLAAAWHYHPFGPILVPVLAGIVVIGAGPAALRRRAADWCSRHRRAVQAAYVVLVGAFVLFGTARAVCHFVWRVPGHP